MYLNINSLFKDMSLLNKQLKKAILCMLVYFNVFARGLNYSLKYNFQLNKLSSSEFAFHNKNYNKY